MKTFTVPELTEYIKEREDKNTILYGTGVFETAQGAIRFTGVLLSSTGDIGEVYYAVSNKTGMVTENNHKLLEFELIHENFKKGDYKKHVNTENYIEYSETYKYIAVGDGHDLIYTYDGKNYLLSGRSINVLNRNNGTNVKYLQMTIPQLNAFGTKGLEALTKGTVHNNKEMKRAAGKILGVLTKEELEQYAPNIEVDIEKRILLFNIPYSTIGWYKVHKDTHKRLDLDVQDLLKDMRTALQSNMMTDHPTQKSTGIMMPIAVYYDHIYTMPYNQAIKYLQTMEGYVDALKRLGEKEKHRLRK